MYIKSIMLSAALWMLSGSVNAATFVEDFSDPFPAWESGWLGLNTNIQNYYGAGSSLAGDFLWITDGDADQGPGETVDIVFDYTFGLSLTSFSIDIDTYVNTSIRVFDGNGSLILDTIANIDAGYETFSVTSLSGISGFSLFGINQVEGNTAIDNVVVSTVPVPAALWLFGSGLLGLSGFSRRSSL